MKKKRKLTALFLVLMMVISLFLTPLSMAALKESGTSKNVTDQGTKPAYVEGEVIVKFQPVLESAQTNSIRANLGLRTTQHFSLTGGEVAKIENGVSVPDMVRELSKNPNVLYAQPNYLYYPRVLPNDTYFNNLWGHHNTGQAVNGQPAGTIDIDIDAPEAWDISMGSSSVIVAIIDEGVDINHPDLAGNIWTNPGESANPNDGIDNDLNGKIDDVNGWDFYNNDKTVFDPEDKDQHGTHIAGTIAGVANNTAGIAGVAPNVKIMSLKFMGPNGGSTSNAIAAIQYATAKGAKISNNSWGFSGTDLALRDAINVSGQVFVAAAGNGGIDGIGDNNDVYPDSPSGLDSPNIISVAAVYNQGGLASFSNYGLTTVDVGSPGVDIYSLKPVYPAMGAAVQIYDPVNGGYKAVHFGFGLEDITNVTNRASVMQRALNFLDTTTSTPILLVDDDNSNAGSPDYLSQIQAALAGYNVTSTFTAGNDINGPLAATMAGKTVIWFTGDAYGSVTNAALTANDLMNLKAFLDGGGRLLLIGEDIAQGNELDGLFTLYMEEKVIKDFTPSTTVTDTVYGYTYALPASPDRDTLVPTGISTRMYNYAASDPATSYQYLNGTSMAAPHVAGVAALMLSVNPSLTFTQINNLLKQTVDPLASLSGKTVTGGMVNAYKAVLAAKIPATPPGLTASPGNQTVLLNWNAVSDADLAGYNIYRNSVKINGSPVVGTSYTDTALTNGTSYGYEIGAVDSYGFESPRTAVVNATPYLGQVYPTLTVTGKTAAKNGATLQFGGTTTVGATVYSAKLEQLDTGGAPISSVDINVYSNVTITSGNIGGTYTIPSFDATAKSVRLNLTVDVSGTKYSGTSVPFTVDNTAPTVALSYNKTSPAGPGPLTITATFNENVLGTPTIDINQPGTTDVIGAAMTATADSKVWIYNYTVVASGGGYADGTATVTVNGMDGAGNANTPATNNTFIIDTTPPATPIIAQVDAKTTPALSNNASPQVVVNNVTAGDTVKIYDGAVEKASVVAAGPSVTITLTGLSEGSHSLTAKAVDSAGNVSAASGAFSYTVDVTAPAAPVIASVDGKTSPAFSKNANPQVIINGVVSGDAVKVYDGANLLATATAAGSSVTVPLSALTDKLYSLTAKSTDPAGNTSAASTVFSYTVDTVAPTISIRVPAPSATGVSVTNNLEITFSEAMNTSYINSANMTLTSAVYGTIPVAVSYDSAANKAVIDPVSPLKYSNQYTITVSASIYDPAGNAITGSPLSWNFTTEADTYPPEILPQTASTNVPLDSLITFTFNEEVVASTVYNAIYNNQILLKKGIETVTASAEFNSSTKIVTIRPAANLQYNTTYTVSVAGVSDLLNNTIVTPRTWNFTTVAQTTSGGGAVGIPPAAPTVAEKDITPTSGTDITIGDVKISLPNGLDSQNLKVKAEVKELNAEDSKGFKPIEAFEITFKTVTGSQEVTTLQKFITITFSYTPLELGSVSANKLGIYYKQSLSDKYWIPVKSKIDAVKGEVTAEVNHATVFALLADTTAPDVPVLEQIPASSSKRVLTIKGKVEPYTTAQIFNNGSLIANKETGGSGAFSLDGLLSAGENRITAKAIDSAGNSSNSTSEMTVNVNPAVLVKDIKSHWAELSVQKLMENGNIAGFPDNTFRPENRITRAEFTVMVIKALGIEIQPYKEMKFADNGKIPAWASSYIGIAVEKGIIMGDNKNNFRPADLITREEMAVIIVRALKYANPAIVLNNSDTGYTDKNSIASWAREAVTAAVQKGIVSGYEDNSFRPKNKATRAEAAVMILRLIETNSK